IYLRWLQRLSSLFFGTMTGRWLTLYLILPFGGAFAALVFVQEIVHLVGIHLHLEPASTGITVGVLGLFLLLLIHVPSFRRQVGKGVKASWRGLRTVVVDAPADFFRLPAVRRVLESRPVVLFRRYVLKAALAAAVAVAACLFFGAGGVLTGGIAAATFLAALAVFNSRFGRRMEEETTDWMARNWYWVRGDVLPGLLRLIMDLFQLI